MAAEVDELLMTPQEFARDRAIGQMAHAMGKTLWPFSWANLNDETTAELIKYAGAAYGSLEPQLTEAWDEVERLRGQVERLQVERHDLIERLIQQGGDPT